MFSISREFSPCGKYCAYISQQGKFVVHDVETSDIHQVYTPNMHLNVPCTSFAWFQVGGDAPAKTKKKSKKARASVGENVQLLVAFGTSKGGVAFYSLATASIERSCKGDGHTAPITAIYFNASHNPDTLYTAGADGKVIEWSISQCKQQKVHHIGVEKLSCVLAHGDKILTGAKQLKLWDAESGTVERTLAGHTANTQLLQLISLDEEHVYALSGSVNDRNLSLWSLSDEDATSAVAAFALDDVPEYIAPKIVDRKLHLVAVSRTGVAHYFVRDMGKLSVKKPYRAAHTFEIAVDTVSTKKQAVDRLPVFVATVQYAAQQEQILLGYGTEHSVRFEHIAIEEDVKQNVIIREPMKVMEGKAKDGELKAKTPILDKVEYLNSANSARKSVKEVEIPMEVRLENLSTPKTSSKNMIHLLMQGMHSRDATLLKSVFAVDDAEMIQQTLERLPSQYVSPLLNELSHLMQMKTMHVKTAVCWLKPLISIHASQLMALGSINLLANFSTCLGIIEYRVEHLNSLSKLRGRLGLLIDQIDRSKNQAANLDDITSGNVLVYQEGDDSDVESMLEKDDPDLPGSSNEEMYDDDDDDDDGEEDETVHENGDFGSFVKRRQNGYSKKDCDEESMDVSD
ncbi:WD repeat-containing protein 43 [Anopheles arabiensis]|uniref:Small-subunit processome Utp12 domain-containing protein n=1 Tax=Anopheles arabiensis TaxID=7173 RepID=A0A182I605_ANOAR|nr:WD repeat-containing protein 43 [Anopheles arabiensis]